MANFLSSEIVEGGKRLIFTVTNYEHDYIPKNIEAVIAEAFARIAPTLKKETQVLHVRDLPELCISDGSIWSANCSGPSEVTIAIPHWIEDVRDMPYFIFVLNETLYKMARRQHLGTSTLFGDEVFNRGLAAYYAHIVTRIAPPCLDREVTKTMRNMARRRWFTWYDGDNKGWLRERYSWWGATRIGYELAQLVCSNNNAETFSLGEALTIHGYRHGDKLWALNHPRRKKSARILEDKVRLPYKSKYSPSSLMIALQDFLLVPRPDDFRHYNLDNVKGP